MEVYLKNSHRILLWLIGLMYVGLFLPIPISNGLFTLLVLFSITKFNLEETINALKSNWGALLLLSIFILQVFGLIYTENLKTGFFMLEKKIGLLVFPLFVFPVFKKHIQNHEGLFKIIGLLTFFASIILLGIAFFRRFVLDYEQAFFFESFRGFEGFSPIHYVYFSMFFSFGILLWINSLFDQLKKKKFGPLALIFLLIYALGIVILVASKTGIIAFILASTILLYRKVRNKRMFTVALMVIGVAAGSLLYINDTTRNRFSGLGKHLHIITESNLPSDLEITDLNMRLLFWKITTYHSWLDGHVLWGTGTGDAQDYIDFLYNLPQYQLYGYIGWDTHNQLVYSFVQLGLPGLLLLLALFGNSFWKAFRDQDLNLLCFLVITILFMMTESILELNKGILFFSFLYCLLLSKPSPAKNIAKPA